MTEEMILASASPTRARMLAAAGLTVRVEPAVLDEECVKQSFRAEARAGIDCALALAEAKARCVAARHNRALVIGADQILICGGAWFDKPANLDDARAQLRALRGRTHELATAVCVVQAGTRIWHKSSRPQRTLWEFSDTFLESYLTAEGEAILGSVGAYRLEGRGVQLFECVKGDHFAVLGLPLIELFGFLRGRGVLPS
jgi:septum formation protein